MARVLVGTVFLGGTLSLPTVAVLSWQEKYCGTKLPKGVTPTLPQPLRLGHGGVATFHVSFGYCGYLSVSALPVAESVTFNFSP